MSIVGLLVLHSHYICFLTITVRVTFEIKSQWVLHDWNDEECINILKNCKEAIPKNTGRVIIIEAVIDEKEDNFSDIRLMLDLVMMAHTKKGKERTREEWTYIINAVGFSRYTITPIQAIQSVIQCFP